MIEEVNPIFNLTDAKSDSRRVTKDEALDTKKCKKCLKRIHPKYQKCPFCGGHDFQFNDS
jgi:uncharacterized OB-fold protein